MQQRMVMGLFGLLGVSLPFRCHDYRPELALLSRQSREEARGYMFRV